MQKKRVAKELLSTFKDESIIVLADWLKVKLFELLSLVALGMWLIHRWLFCQKNLCIPLWAEEFKTRTPIVVSNGRYTFYQVPFIKYLLSNTIYQILFAVEIFFNEWLNQLINQ